MREAETAPLKPSQARAVVALLREPTVAKAARHVGVNERTLRRWLADPGFRAALDDARREVFGEVLAVIA